ncbi:hypothetical protein [Halalkalibacterium ligniniphilum]|uniref:hypothetical protein n=1 Tax=Halalkalibacterium ligniniphilum TaxID=1134413 RepID=UPI00034A4158|nr:hypothetical protein [Halalkalibacterium ligniniphilum]
MFDPTIYENLKVILEGNVYDLDLAGEINVINRSDLVDLATMSRMYSVEFQTREAQSSYPYAEILLQTSIVDFTIEKIEGDEKKAGCEIEVNFYAKIEEPEKDCPTIEKHLADVWNQRPVIRQEIMYQFGRENQMFTKININFERKINEQQIDDLRGIVEYSLQSLDYLNLSVF